MRKTFVILLTLASFIACNQDRNLPLNDNQNKANTVKPKKSGELLFLRSVGDEEVDINSNDSSLFVTSSYGAGKLILDYEEDIYSSRGFELCLYEDYTDTTIYRIIKYVLNDKGFIQSENDTFIKIKDYYLTDPYFIIHFICLKQEGEYYQVMVNETTKEKMWIKQKEKHVFLSWEDYLKSRVCVSQKDIKANPARMSPKDISKITYTREMCWDVIEMKKDWIKVKFSEIEADLENPDSLNFRAWIKWRNEEDLLLEYYLSI